MSRLNKDYNKSSNLEKINTKYIIIKIFDNLHQNRLLNIINYNKQYQKLMNKKLIDYKSEYLKIEIEIIPEKDEQGDFINISKKNESNFHIYFNDNEKEIKIKTIDKKDKVNKIKIIIDYKIMSLSNLFRFCHCIKKVNFIKFNREDITNMSNMFHGCYSLKELNLSHFNTNNVINMESMFHGCSSLKELNLSNFNTYNVINMSNMFSGCSSLKELNIMNFNTNNIINMSNMFSGCFSLKELNLMNFKTNNVTNMWRMFMGCSSLKELNLSNFNTDKVKNVSDMFHECSSLKKLISSNKKIIKELEFR